MKSNYKLLRDYITRVNLRNKDLKTTNLKGLSMNKEFRESTSNIIGVDLSKYKLVPKNHFACDFMSVIRVHKLPVVHQNTDELIIVSPAYTVFKVIDENILNPEYLMMWFRRPEFDRYADFRCDSAIRGGFKWDELGEVELPIPSIEKQHEIVKEYNTVANRITLNETINKKLEDTAQALYKHWFVDFEFPNEQGKPYKSNGGKMVFNEELDLEIPLGWESGKFDKYVILSQGQVINAKTRHLVVKKGLPLLKITDLFNNTATMFIDSEKVSKKNIATKDELIYTRTGQVGYVFRNKEGVVYNNCFKITPIKEGLSKEFIYWYLKDENTRRLMTDLASGSAQADLTHSAFFSVSIINPSYKIQEFFSKISLTIVRNIDYNHQLNFKLNTLKNLLLSKMSKVAIEKETVC
ncbi:restriction endonuclease subunit S [Tenacibaculum dicentrarchi]|nr:restriction endonuclease subunit S [Tenacibaculum dicentrarchi]